MGMTDVKLTIKNPTQPELQATDLFLVDSGPASPATDREQFSRVADFEAAFQLVFDLSDGGLNPGGEYIVDADGNVVFTVDDKSDLVLLREMYTDA